MFGNALAFLAGDCLIQGLPVLPAPGWSAVLLVALAVAVARRSSLVICAVAGIGWAWGSATYALAHDLPAALEGEDVEVVGDIASLPEITSSGPRFQFEIVDWPWREATSLPRRIELTWYDTAVGLKPGERWQLTVRLRRRHGYANPGGYDYEAQLFREGIGATGYVRDGDNRRLAESSWRYPILQLRGLIATRLATALPDSPMLGVIQGLAVGARQQLPAEQWRVFAATGTSHLMAISGLHIAMVAALTAALGAAMVRLPGMQRLRFSASDGRAIGCIVGALAYAGLAGFGVPAQRTLLMIVIYCGARLLRRELRATQGFALSLIGVLLIDPLAPLSVGAWLSFGAVGAILCLLTGRVKAAVLPGWSQGLSEFLKVQWAVTIGLLPLAILVFGNVSLVSPVVNLLAIPFFTWLVVPLVLLGSAALFLPVPLAAALLAGANGLLVLAWPVLAWFASLDVAVWHSPDPPLWAKGLLCLGAALVLAPGFLPTRLVGILCFVPALLWRPEPPESGGFRLTVLDAGQGLAVVVETRTHRLLYDAGPAFQGGSDTGERVVLPYLYGRAVRRLDVVVASHGDLDHVGGLKSVLPAMPVTAILAGPSVRLPGAILRQCQRGQHWRWDGVDFDVLHPAAGPGLRGDNNTSCVLKVSSAGGTALLLGDIERDAERSLVDAGLLGPTSVVVAAHHGSRTSSTTALVEVVHAQYVVFAVGYRNRWGFPRPDVVTRWRDSGATTLDTAASGAVEVVVGPGGIARPVVWRRQSVRYWHHNGNGDGD
ncbi:MAG: DNA internalization-related competence protein ComEC/Rec2 [Steroidobacteraceae bacterium]